MRRIAAAALTAAVAWIALAPPPARAETIKLRDSWGDERESSREPAAPKAAKPKSAKTQTGVMVLKCKSDACWKKHPDGTYIVMPKQKQQ